MDEQMYGLAQTGIYASAAFLAAVCSAGIYCRAKFASANIKARSDAKQAAMERGKQIISDPIYMQLVDKRVQVAEKLSERDALAKDTECLEAQLDAICGELP